MIQYQIILDECIKIQFEVAATPDIRINLTLKQKWRLPICTHTNVVNIICGNDLKDWFASKISLQLVEPVCLFLSFFMIDKLVGTYIWIDWWNDWICMRRRIFSFHLLCTRPVCSINGERATGTLFPINLFMIGICGVSIVETVCQTVDAKQIMLSWFELQTW